MSASSSRAAGAIRALGEMGGRAGEASLGRERAQRHTAETTEAPTDNPAVAQ
ncbi:MAG TPA: hypothetical protein VJN29_03100 [Intrasporangium sp.]|uniref:hypothetical protein n=1 Tax=Intrasporangium sp. TaxID=1925024 RepID=UPI002B4668A1|nr:hypothetical protein [Intrasporangium sp.]HKX66188.1 hypothetical protein [Intrasporangium sp.]